MAETDAGYLNGSNTIHGKTGHITLTQKRPKMAVGRPPPLHLMHHMVESIIDLCSSARASVGCMGIVAMVKHAILGMLILAVSGTTAQAETCWSLMDTPDWPNIRASIEQIKICEVLPGGPNRTRRFEATQIDICSAPLGFRVKSRVETSCATSDAAFIRFSVPGTISPDVTVDVGACRITSLDVDISGDVGKYLTNLGLLQPVLLGWAQGQLNRLCGKS